MARRRFMPALRGLTAETKALNAGPTLVDITDLEAKTVIVGGAYSSSMLIGGGTGSAAENRADGYDLDTVVIDGYERVVWVYKSVEFYAGHFSRLPFVIGQHRGTDREKILDDHPLYRVLNKQANPLETGQVFRKRLSAQVLLSKRGAFVEVSKSRAGTIIRLDLLPPSRVRPVPDPNGNYLLHFEFTERSGNVREIPPERIRWVRNAHPTDPFSGVTPLDASGASVELDHLYRMYNSAFIKNDARPGGIVGVDADTLSDAEMRRVESRFAPGAHSAGLISVIATGPGGLRYVDTTTRPRDMAYSEGAENAKIEILSSFGLGESLFGNASGRCVDDQTEALTQRGWVAGQDLTTDDAILSMDPADGRLKWGPVREVYRNPDYHGPMFRLRHSHMDALVTPGHNWAVEPSIRERKAGESAAYVLRKVEEIGSRERIRVMGEAEQGADDAAFSSAFVELVGWYVTEGHQGGKQTPYLRIRQNNGPGADRIERCLKEVGARFGRYDNDGRKSLFNVRGEVAVAVDAVAPGKVMTTEFLLALTAAQRNLLMQTMLDGDGCRQLSTSSWTFAQKDKAASEAFVFLATLCGYTTSLREREYVYAHKGVSEVRSDWIAIVRQRKVMTLQRDTRTIERYDGLVWCPRTDYGTFVARRGGRVFVTGNTFDNAEQEKFNAWTESLVPHFDLITAAFDVDVDDAWDPYIDTRSVDVLELPRRKAREEARTEVENGLRSVNEYRPLAGLDPVDNAYARALWISPSRAPIPMRPDDAVSLGLADPNAPAPEVDENGQPIVDGEVVPGALPPGTSAADAVAAARGDATGPARTAAEAVAAARGLDPTGVLDDGSAEAAVAAARAGDGGGGEPGEAAATVAAARGQMLEGKALTAGDKPRQVRYEPSPDEARRAELALAAALDALLVRQQQIVTARLESPKTRRGTRFWQPDGDNDPRAGTEPIVMGRVVDTDRWVTETVETVQPLVEQYAAAAGAGLLAAFAADGVIASAPAPAVAGQVEFAAEAVNLSAGLVLTMVTAAGEAMRAWLRDVEARLDAEQMTATSVDEVVEALRAFYTDRIGQLAESIAVSISGGTVNGARETVAAALTPMPKAGRTTGITREWVSQRDERVRPSHQEAHGQVLPVGQPFTVGGFPLRWPTDPLAPPSETRNCRCRAWYRTVSSARFLLPPAPAA